MSKTYYSAHLIGTEHTNIAVVHKTLEGAIQHSIASSERICHVLEMCGNTMIDLRQNKMTKPILIAIDTFELDDEIDIGPVVDIAPDNVYVFDFNALTRPASIFHDCFKLTSFRGSYNEDDDSYIITDFVLTSTKTETVQVDDSTTEVRAKVIEFHKNRIINFHNGESMYLRD